MLAYDYPLLGAFWTLAMFALFVLVLFVILWAFVDNFRRKDQGGLAKAGWFIVIIFLPLLGTFIYLIARPAVGVASLTLVLASLFLVEGILNIVLFFRARSLRGSSWVLIDGIITLLLGLMIYAQWPSSSAWAIGTLVGVSMIISGVTRVMLSLAVRKAANTVSSKLAA